MATKFLNPSSHGSFCRSHKDLYEVVPHSNVPQGKPLIAHSYSLALFHFIKILPSVAYNNNAGSRTYYCQVLHRADASSVQRESVRQDLFLSIKAHSINCGHQVGQQITLSPLKCISGCCSAICRQIFKNQSTIKKITPLLLTVLLSTKQSFYIVFC